MIAVTHLGNFSSKPNWSWFKIVPLVKVRRTIRLSNYFFPVMNQGNRNEKKGRKEGEEKKEKNVRRKLLAIIHHFIQFPLALARNSSRCASSIREPAYPFLPGGSARIVRYRTFLPAYKAISGTLLQQRRWKKNLASALDEITWQGEMPPRPYIIALVQL